MDSAELNELQSPETWEDGDDEVRPAVKSPRAVVSVGFARDDFQRVAECARQRGMKTSEFIRRAALDQAAARHDEAVVISVSGAVRTAYPPVVGSRSQVRVTTQPDPVFATA